MYLERLNIFNEDNPYYVIGGEFNTYKGEVQMPNCCAYAYLRMEEALELKEKDNYLVRSSGGFGNAKTWFDTTPLPKGYKLKDGCVAVFNGSAGHVCFCEEMLDDTHAIITESQYDSDKSLRNYKYWNRRSVELVVGKATLSGVGELIGFIYPPINDKRTDSGIEIIEDYVNVRTAPEGEILMNGCYCPRGFYKPLEKVFVNGHQWFKLDTNAWVRDGEWLKQEKSEVEEMLKDFAAIKRIISKYV